MAEKHVLSILTWAEMVDGLDSPDTNERDANRAALRACLELAEATDPTIKCMGCDARLTGAFPRAVAMLYHDRGDACAATPLCPDCCDKPDTLGRVHASLKVAFPQFDIVLRSLQ